MLLKECIEVLLEKCNKNNFTVEMYRKLFYYSNA